MFGSAVLDIAIGLIFVYLLLSLICSALNELIEGWLKNRSVKLEQGLRELLGDPNGTGLVADLYAHPLISSLFRGQYNPEYMTGKAAFFRRLFGRIRLPSYIPSQNFALALMDIIAPGVESTPAPAERPTKGTPASPEPGAPVKETAPAAEAVITRRRSGAAAATKRQPPMPDIVVNLGAVVPPPVDDDGAMKELRQAILTIPNAQVKKALITLVDAAGNDVTKARQNIENWFNGSMDRISSWYKRRSQAMILVFGFAVAIAMNADTVYIVRALANDPALRNTLVSAADNYAKLKAAESAAATQAPAGDESRAAATKTAAGSNHPVQSSPVTASPHLQSSSTDRAATPPDSPSPAPLPKSLASTRTAADPCDKDENSPDCRFARTRAEIQKLGLPIGWDSEDDIYRRWPGNHWKHSGGWWQQVYRHWLGWFITAMAISLGAPFWFDLLNKFIVIRSTVKPHEKSQEERSKD